MITGIPPHVDFEQFQKTFGVCMQCILCTKSNTKRNFSFHCNFQVTSEMPGCQVFDLLDCWH